MKHRISGKKNTLLIIATVCMALTLTGCPDHESSGLSAVTTSALEIPKSLPNEEIAAQIVEKKTEYATVKEEWGVDEPPNEYWIEDGFWHDDPEEQTIGHEVVIVGDDTEFPYSITVPYPADEFDYERAKEDMMKHVKRLFEPLQELVKSLGLWDYTAEKTYGVDLMFSSPRDGLEFYAGQIRIDSPKGRAAFRVQGQVFPEEHAYKCGYLTLTPNEIKNDLDFVYDSSGSLISSGYPSFWKVNAGGIEDIRKALQALK